MRGTYWAVPSAMAASSVVLSVVMIDLDQALTAQFLIQLSWVHTGGPEGARAVLSTVAASMITVAGVTFSITIVALTLASQQFGPRLLRNFLRDLGNQITLGTFIATFLLKAEEQFNRKRREQDRAGSRIQEFIRLSKLRERLGMVGGKESNDSGASHEANLAVFRSIVLPANQRRTKDVRRPRVPEKR